MTSSIYSVSVTGGARTVVNEFWNARMGIAKGVEHDMTQADLYTVGSFLLITAAFALTRSRRPLFVLLSLLVVSSFVYFTANLQWRTQAEYFFSLAGLLLYALGLLILRIMFIRSVSLKLLFRFCGEMARESAQESIARRFDDFKRYHLIRVDTEPYELSGFGKFIAAIVTSCYFLLGIK